MLAFLNIILIAVLIFYSFALIIKLIFKRKMRKLEKQREQYTQGDTQPKNNEAKNPHIDPNIGEYTDFEEIEK